MTDNKPNGQPADDLSPEGLQKHFDRLAEEQARTVDPEDMARAAPPPPPPGGDDEGKLIETFISGRDFATEAWALQNIVPRPPGTHVTVGRIIGVASRGEWKESTFRPPSGEVLKPSFVVRGQFEATSALTGEVKTAPWLYLPRSAAELLAEAFDKGAETILIDVEIGLQATGARPPYRWTVRTFNDAARNENNRLLGVLREQAAAREARRSQARISAPTEAPLDPPPMGQARAKTL